MRIGIFLEGSNTICTENKIHVPAGAISIRTYGGSSGNIIQGNTINAPIGNGGGVSNTVIDNEVTEW